MSIGSYFVSNESENAATQTIIDTYKSATNAKAMRSGQMHSLADKLAAFVEILKYPDDYAVRIDANELVVGRDRRTVARLEPPDLDWKQLTEMLANYYKASADKKASAARLKDMGLTVEE